MTITPPLFVITCDGPDLCELALREPTEDEQNAALLEIERMKLKRKRENTEAEP